MMKSNNVIVWTFFIFLITVSAIFGVSYYNRLQNYQRRVSTFQSKVSKINYNKKDAKEIPDGKYFGACDVDFIVAEVAVIVKDGQMREITVEHHYDKGFKAEEVVNYILDYQTVDVDTITGATSSSIVIKKAVDDALDNAVVTLKADSEVIGK